MKKGVDYTGITISFRCHDGQGNYVMHRRNENCRDEHGCWDFGGGALKFGETLEEGLRREVREEYGVEVLDFDFLGHRELFREHNGSKTHWIKFQFFVLVEREKVVNNEPEKHEEVGWFTLDRLPCPLHSAIPEDLQIYNNISI